MPKHSDAQVLKIPIRRMFIASETDKHARISSSKVKRLTGGDTIKTRAIHDKHEIKFNPLHNIFLYPNRPIEDIWPPVKEQANA